jgi:predicted TIM-barrel fold metal-dependent hydrolase
MKKFGIEKALVSCFTPLDLDFVKANREIQKVVRDNQRALKGVAVVDPRLRDQSLSILKQMVKTHGFSGILLNPFEQSFKVNGKFLSPIMDLAEEFRVPVIVESGYPIVSTPLQVAELSSDFRNVPIVMTYSGQRLASGQSESDALLAMTENPNLYSETSGTALSGIGGFIEQVFSEHSTSRSKGWVSGGERVIFGSESPLLDLGVELQRIIVSSISDKQKQMILRDNAVSLFEL